MFLETRENIHKRTEVGSYLLGKGGHVEVTSPQTEVIFYNICRLQTELGQLMKYHKTQRKGLALRRMPVSSMEFTFSTQCMICYNFIKNKKCTFAHKSVQSSI